MMQSKFYQLFTALSCSAVMAAFAISASANPIVSYDFPASWDGTGGAGSAVVDQSPAGNDGTTSGAAATSANIPPGAAAGTLSLNPSGEGGVLTNNIDLLENPTLEAFGGYVFSASIFWDGGTGNRTVQKIIDNEGTDSLQLGNIDDVNGTADLQMTMNDTTILSLPIVANQWYDVSATFDATGNSIDGNGDLAGTATLATDSASISAGALRTVGDPGSSAQFDRPIAVGVLALPAVPTLVNFSGDIYNPSVALLIPEPASVALLAMTVLVVGIGRRRSLC